MPESIKDPAVKTEPKIEKHIEENRTPEAPEFRPHPADPRAQLLYLQRVIGNRAVANLCKSGLSRNVRTNPLSTAKPPHNDSTPPQTDEEEIQPEPSFANPKEDQVAPLNRKSAPETTEEKPLSDFQISRQAFGLIGRNVLLRLKEPTTVSPSSPGSAGPPSSALPAADQPVISSPIGEPGPTADVGPSAQSQSPGADVAPEQSSAGQTPPVEAGAARSEGAAPSHPEGRDGAEKAAAETAAQDKAGGGREQATPTISSASAEELLMSLASVPVSRLGKAFGPAKAAATTIWSRDKEAAQNAIPAIDQPTGMPPRTPKAAKTTNLPKDQPPAPQSEGGRTGPTPDLHQPEPTAPLPGSQVSTAAAEPAATDDGGGSWWSWLTNRLRNFFGSLPTSDPNVSTSAGPRQRIDMTGDADPTQNDQNQQASVRSVEAHRAEADAATAVDFGENDIAPTLTPGKLRSSYQPGPPKGAGGASARDAVELPAKERAEFDSNAAPWLQEQVDDQLGNYSQQRAIYERDSQAAQEAGNKKLAEETDRTRIEQETMRNAAKTDVDQERLRWQDENRKIQQDFGDKATARRQEIDRQINTKVTETHREADAKFDEAEKQAAKEKTKTENEVAEKKREAENRPRSWWDRVKGAVSDAFNAIRSAITGLFDKLRKLVKGIIEAAKQVVHGIIEAARSVIVGLIKGFGEFVKGLVSIALAAFPELAAKARNWIDARVDGAVDTVNRAAEALKEAADEILDGIGEAIDMALDILEAGLLAAIDVLETLAMLPFQAMEALAKLVAWVEKNGKFVLAALSLESNSDGVIQGLKNAIGGMIAQVPGSAYAKLQEFASQLGGDVAVATTSPAPATAAPKAADRAPSGVIQRTPDDTAATPAQRHVPASQHVQGVLRHLEKGLEHLKNNWWEELKKVGWNLLWPWPAVWKDLKDIWGEIKAGFDDAYHLRVGKVIDHVLTATQKLNSILGNLYGWFFIASVLIGAIIGAFFGGAGALPGALAGATFAGEVGEGLVLALIATETAVILKSVADLTIGNDTQDEDEEDYGKIGGSILTIAITGAMILLGEIAAKLAKSIWEGVAGVFRGEKAPEVKVGVEGEPVRTADTPEARGEAPEIIEGEQVVAHEPTADGHEVKITEEGRCLICSTCEEIQIKYKEELEGTSPEIENIKAELEEAKGMPNGDEKAQAIERVKEKLDEVRAKARESEPLQMKIDGLEKDSVAARGAIDEAKGKFRSEDVGELRADPATKKELARMEAEVDALGREWQQLKEQMEQAISEAKDPDIAGDPELSKLASEEVERLRGELDDLRTKAEKIKQELDEKVRVNEEHKQQQREQQAAAEAHAEEQVERINNLCDYTDGTKHPEASIGDGSTEAVLREEIRTGEPIKSAEGHYMKTEESIHGLRAALEELNEARPLIDDPVKLEAIDDAIARANDRIAKLESAWNEWQQRATTHPDVFNPDGTSKVTPDWPSHP